MQPLAVQNVEYFEFDIPTHRKDAILIIKNILATLKIEANDEMPKEKEVSEKINSRLDEFRKLTGVIKADKLPSLEERENFPKLNIPLIRTNSNIA